MHVYNPTLSTIIIVESQAEIDLGVRFVKARLRVRFFYL